MGIDTLKRSEQAFAEARDYAENVIQTVRDNSGGMAADTLAHIFELFTQAEQSLARSRDGLGIGPALVKSLVELHGGNVEAEGEGLGQGGEFIVRLPLATSLANTKYFAAPVEVSDLKALLPGFRQNAADPEIEPGPR